ncbi:helix-hairpin-helix domain-containing protein [Microcystis aeruginosa]|uniref:helix-hairpin-helix domain-containing protein n=1 Tax=Microcystis aeruginosa TaxID=1126 RepID=UPI00188019AB|nr:helix-hairpin-helix domain-containing protein [Microcystis aeruginosa]MBE8994005.1 helix-hairpin-helix domain-containing protein [Microcystis aeruginosa LEGE 91341]
MSNLSPPPPESSEWIWLSLVPVFGGLAIANAGKKTNNQSWLSVGIALTIISLIFLTQESFIVIWFAQIGLGLYIRQQLNSHPMASGNTNSGQSFSPLEKIDINSCSTNDLVYKLGLPIVYANDIVSVRNEGHIFTHLEELHFLAGLPENYLKKLEPLVIFAYDIRQEVDISWRCLNYYSVAELVNLGLDFSVADKIVAEREKNGVYRSAIELRNRTGIPLKSYQQLL